MAAREKSDILSGMGAGFEILKALRDAGASDEDLRELLQEGKPYVAKRCVSALKGETIQDSISRGANTLEKVIATARKYGLPFRIGVGVHGPSDPVFYFIQEVEKLGFSVKVEGGTSICTIWING